MFNLADRALANILQVLLTLKKKSHGTKTLTLKAQQLQTMPMHQRRPLPRQMLRRAQRQTLQGHPRKTHSSPSNHVALTTSRARLAANQATTLSLVPPAEHLAARGTRRHPMAARSKLSLKKVMKMIGNRLVSWYLASVFGTAFSLPGPFYYCWRSPRLSLRDLL